MRSLAELADVRLQLRHNNAWSMLLTLHTEASDAGDEPFTRSIFDIGYLSDLPPARVGPILDELVDVGAIAVMPIHDDRTFEITVQ